MVGRLVLASPGGSFLRKPPLVDPPLWPIKGGDQPKNGGWTLRLWLVDLWIPKTWTDAKDGTRREDVQKDQRTEGGRNDEDTEVGASQVAAKRRLS
jgi:hypothetical protein